MADPAGWYADPTTKHELRYWDGYAWLDNVSDKGTTATDPLGGKPMPPPSEASKGKQGGPSATTAKSKMPIFIGVAVAVAVVAIAAVLVTRGGGGGGAKVTTLGNQVITFDDDVADIVHPVVHTVHIKANNVVLVTMKSDNKDVTPGYVVLASRKVVDDVGNKISGASDLLTGQLRNACSNLREEDIGAKGTLVYREDTANRAGEQLDSFMVVVVEGDYEFVPVLVNADGKCEAGKSSMQLDPKPLDFSSVNNIDDLSSVISRDSDLNSILPG
ncbi:MAG: hypothetical protein QOC92_1416 [Acidimicrobiaceae bacterium]|jgi:hypothetical protein